MKIEEWTEVQTAILVLVRAVAKIDPVDEATREAAHDMVGILSAVNVYWRHAATEAIVDCPEVSDSIPTNHEAANTRRQE